MQRIFIKSQTILAPTYLACFRACAGGNKIKANSVQLGWTGAGTELGKRDKEEKVATMFCLQSPRAAYALGSDKFSDETCQYNLLYWYCDIKFWVLASWKMFASCIQVMLIELNWETGKMGPVE
jgi:hypothetical protein